jgi:hypothetical protein
MRDIVQELAGQYAQQASAASSSSSGPGGPAAALSQQQQLVFELNASGKYLEIKQQLRPLLCELVSEQYSTAAGPSRPSPAEVQQLHHDLYSSLVQELHAALADVAAQAAAKQQQQQQGEQSAGPEKTEGIEGHAVQSLECQQQQQQQQLTAQQVAEGQRLLQLAAECELLQDTARCHDLHMRRIALLSTAQVGSHEVLRAAVVLCVTDTCRPLPPCTRFSRFSRWLFCTHPNFVQLCQLDMGTPRVVHASACSMLTFCWWNLGRLCCCAGMV